MTRLLGMLGIALALVNAPTASAQAGRDVCSTVTNCPRPTRSQMNYLCSNVSTQNKDENDDSQFLYVYEETLWELAGARPGVDSEEMAHAKVRVLWGLYHDDFTCNTAGLKNGGILKYGVSTSFVHFVKDMVKEYRFDVNFPDQEDGKTVTDYVYDEIGRLANQPNHAAQLEELVYVRNFLREWKGKRASELKPK